MDILIIIIGLVVGSFLNVCIYRIPKGRSIAFPPSACGFCGHRLSAIDMIPLLSYIFLSGKCRHCGEKVSIRYFVVELVTSTMFLLSYRLMGEVSRFVIITSIICILIIICGIDLEHQIIPDILVIALIPFCLGYAFICNRGLMDIFLGAIVGGGFLLLISIISRGGMGGGDIKLMSVLGLSVGLRGTGLSLYFAFIVGGILATFLLTMRIKKRGQTIPFGPFIALGYVLFVWYGEIIIDLYLKFMG